jgi:hypothetical protein
MRPCSTYIQPGAGAFYEGLSSAKCFRLCCGAEPERTWSRAPGPADGAMRRSLVISKEVWQQHQVSHLFNNFMGVCAFLLH